MSLVIALVFALAAAQQTQPPAPGTTATVLGDWDLTFETPQGSNTARVTFKQDGGTITAGLVVPLGTVELSGAESVDGNLKMSGAVQMQGTTLPLALGARIQGETLSGLLTVGAFGEMAFTGKRPDKLAVAPPDSAASPVREGSNLTGTWNIVFTMATFGAFPVSAVLDQQGDKVTGTLSSPLGALAVSGRMAGGTLQLECIAGTPQGNITVTMTGQIGPDGLAGKASVAGIGEADWTGVRAP
jgi:hypothetical protein